MCHVGVKDLRDIYKWCCGPFCASHLVDGRLKGPSYHRFCLHFFQQWALLRRTPKLVHHILLDVTKFRRSERDNLLLTKKTPRKYFKKTNNMIIILHDLKSHY